MRTRPAAGLRTQAVGSGSLCRHQGGFALILVMGALALMAFVAAQFSQRMDQLRSQAATLKEYAEGRRLAHNAQQQALIHLVTHRGGPSGFGPPYQPAASQVQGLASEALLTQKYVRANGGFMELDSGALVAVLDQRALLSINVASPSLLGRLLSALGATAIQRDTLLDVLEDYKDTDNLRRLNGAEEPQYLELGLTVPRNDWLLSVRELGRMPYWRDHPQWLQSLESLTSTRRTGVLNPLLAPLPVLRAVFPLATEEQWALFDTLRMANPYLSASAAQAVTGLNFQSDEYIFHTSDEQAVIAWAPGLPKAYQIRLTLTPGDPSSPWKVYESHTVARPRQEDLTMSVVPRFPQMHSGDAQR